MTTAEFATVVIAVYAAVVSTVVLAWDVVKWRMSGPRLRITVQVNLMFVGNGKLDPTRYVGAQVTNCGDRPTTLQSFGAFIYKNDWLASVQSNRPDICMIFPEGHGVQTLPLLLEPGQQWRGLIEQSAVESIAREKCLMIAIYHSHSPKPALHRVMF